MNRKEVYSIDDRTSTVKKVLKVFKENGENLDTADEVLKLAFGKSYEEIAKMDMPFSAYQKLTETVISAITGQEQKEQSFQERTA